MTVRAYNGSYWGDWTTISLSSVPASVSSSTAISPGISPASVTTGLGMSTVSCAGSAQVAIHRFFDKNDGTHFFTASATEAAILTSGRSDLSYEGVGLRGYDAPDATPSSQAVFRFCDLADGTHFYTTSASERDSLLTSPSSGMKYEGIAFYEDSVPQAGDTAVFRFFDTVHGTHLFTQSAGE